ncbi:MAG: hypothetical protein Q9192_007502, partial [Flavoplaca navasiana]
TTPTSRKASPVGFHADKSDCETDNVELLPPRPSRNSRKRILEDESIGNSSDTPLFSSDDHPASAEDYLEPHSKRQRKGPWWCSRPETQELIVHNKSKRDFKRNFDSGIWMGSDSDVEDEIGYAALNHQIQGEPSYASGGTTAKDPENLDGPVFPCWDTQPVSTEAFWRTQRAAIKEISRCVDHGIETVDLAHFGLTKLQESTLEPLRFLVAERNISLPNANSQTFETFIPCLELYLANNSLLQLPGQLFRLRNLTVLSLRHNNLTEIPAAIGELVNLRELNISNNRLRWLPCELLQLLSINLRIYRFHPNPFVEPVLGTIDQTLPSSNSYRNQLAFFRIDGTIFRDSSPSPTTAYPCSAEPGIPNPVNQDYPKQSGKVPSLFETSLRACSKLPELSELPYLIPQDGPDTVRSNLMRTWKLKQEGGQRCSVCKSIYIVPRTQWIEWWQWPRGGPPDFFTIDSPFPTMMDMSKPIPHCNPSAGVDTSVVAFIRRGCSWSCVPEPCAGGSDIE